MLVRGVPISFDTSRDSIDVNECLVEDNADIFMRPSALQSVKFLENDGGRASQKRHGSLILDFTDPAIANTCISRHITFHGDLLPAIKFTHHPLCCFNCHHTGHFACSCRAKASCGLCAGDHDTRRCRIPKKDRPVSQPESTPRLKCAVCSGPHTAWNKMCLARKAAISEHRMETTYTGPFFPIPNQHTFLGSLPGDMVSGDHPNLRHPVWCTHSVAS